MEKRGQVTLFIILGLVIVVSVIMVSIMMLNKNPAEVEATPQNLGPKGFIQSCVEDILEDSEAELLQNGLLPNPTLQIAHNGTDVNYHCYSANNYEGCYNLHPRLEEKIEEKIEADLMNEDPEEGLSKCFSVLLEDFESQGYDVTGDTAVISADILPDQIRVAISKPITISRGDSMESFEIFDTSYLSPLYNFVKISKDIQHSESIICDFEWAGYVTMNPRYRIYPSLKSDDSKIYQIVDTELNKGFSMAVRSCAHPPGLF